MPSPLPHLFSWPFVYQPSRTQVWTFPHGILLITHAHHQPVVPVEHKGTRNMPPGASETYIENHWSMLKHWISECHTLESLELGFRQVLPLSEVIAEAGAVFEQGLSKQSKVVLRSGRVQHGSTTFCSLIIAAVVVTECHWITMHWRCWCGKWSQWSNETLRFHNLAHRICFLPVLIAGPSWASRGRGNGFEQCLVTKASGSKLDVFHVFFPHLPGEGC